MLDLDGTLVDSYSAIARSLNCARAAFDLPPLPEAVVRRAVGHGLETLVADWVGADRVAAGVELFREHYAKIHAAETAALPGVAGALAALHQAGLRLSVASNKPARFSEGILRSLGWRAWLDCVAGPDVVGTTKPDPAMIGHCLAAMGLRPEQALYVGDMLLDVESGDRAGVAVVLVASGSCPGEDLARAGRPVLGSLAELPGWLGL